MANNERHIIFFTKPNTPFQGHLLIGVQLPRAIRQLKS